MPAQNNMLFPSNWYNSNNPVTYYRALPIYQLPASLTIRKLLELVQIGQFNLYHENYSLIDL